MSIRPEQFDFPANWLGLLVPPSGEKRGPPEHDADKETTIKTQAPHRDHYASFADLQTNEVEGKDYRRQTRPIDGSRVAVIAPHGGSIEHHTSEIAKAVAGDDYNLYLFEGIKRPDGNGALHVTSHNFDDPQCLDLIAPCDFVVAIHGCAGDSEDILIGGLDDELIALMAQQLTADGFAVQTAGHKFPGKESGNICNRGRCAKGVQLELSASFRKGQHLNKFATSVRNALEKVAAQA